MRRRIRKLSSQIFLAQLALLTVLTVVGFALTAQSLRAHLDEDYEARASAVAKTFAEIPTIRGCMENGGPNCAALEESLSLSTARRVGASYIVLIDLKRVRHSHPDTNLIGQKVSEPLVARDGRAHLGTDNGATGLNANARVPLYGTSGALIGEVSVGLRESSVSSELVSELPSYALWFALVLGLGALGSFALANFLKRKTFGLELHEIARLLQEREATLHGIREGVIAVDPAGRISVVNDEAQRLLRIPENASGHRLEDVLPPGPLRDVLAGTTEVTDQVAITDDHCLIINRMPVLLGGRLHGAVVTLRDRTDIEGLTRELDGERSLTESMRAQQHEFSNRMHAVAGLLELGRSAEALEYLNEIRGTTADFDQHLRAHIGAPQIVGLMLGKAAEASERGIEFVLTSNTSLGDAPDRVQAITTVLGNLIDNAFDALSGTATPRRVEVSVVESSQSVTVVVADNGPGVPRTATLQIFRSGYTTKHGSLVRHSGIGLSLVHNTVTKMGGTVTVSEAPGATFTVVLPRARELQLVATR